MLHEARIRSAKPTAKAYKLFDMLGLYIRIEPGGGRLWRFKYRYNGSEKLLALGSYPEVSLKRAREKRDEARRLLADGIDPNIHRKVQKQAKANTFELVALEWLELHRNKFAPATFEKAEWTVKDLVNPFIGSRPITEIDAPELLAVFRRLEARGKAKRRTGRSSDAARSFDTPSLLAARRVIQPLICEERSHLLSRSITRQSLSPLRSASY